MGFSSNLPYDALVLGGGLAGLEAALNLAEQDFSVAIPEKDPSIRGRMIRLSQVFPTLDCSSCLTPPKMSATAIIATGFQMTPVENRTQYGQGQIPPGITARQMARLLAPPGSDHRVLSP